MKSLFVFAFFLLTFGFLEAGDKKGRILNEQAAPTLSAEQRMELGLSAVEEEEWKTAIQQFKTMLRSFPKSPQSREGHYYLALSLAHLGAFEEANEQLNIYLKQAGLVSHFEDAFYLKFSIAEQFRQGVKKRLFGAAHLPKIVSAQDDAVAIYDEIALALPSHPLAVKSLYAKASIQREEKDFHGSIETLQNLAVRFPTDELAAEAYVSIAQQYLLLSRIERNDPDLLGLSQINLRQFSESFPSDPRITEAKKTVGDIRETCARGLYETGQFYERIKQPQASVIYYINTLRDYPETEAAQKSKERLKALKSYVDRFRFSAE